MGTEIFATVFFVTTVDLQTYNTCHSFSQFVTIVIIEKNYVLECKF